MMRTVLVVIAALFASSLFADSPIATVNAPPDLKINGKTVPNTGAPNWPLAKGDELITGTSPAVISFPDGATVTMQPASKLILRTCDRCIIQFFEGTVDYSKPADSKLELCALGHPVRPAPATQGSVIIESQDKVIVKVAGKSDQVEARGKCPCDAGAPWATAGMTLKRKAALVIIPGAAATAATIAVTRPAKTSTE
jgi:hypothetical protein